MRLDKVLSCHKVTCKNVILWHHVYNNFKTAINEHILMEFVIVKLHIEQVMMYRYSKYKVKD